MYGVRTYRFHGVSERSTRGERRSETYETRTEHNTGSSKNRVSPRLSAAESASGTHRGAPRFPSGHPNATITRRRLRRIVTPSSSVIRLRARAKHAPTTPGRVLLRVRIRRTPRQVRRALANWRNAPGTFVSFSFLFFRGEPFAPTPRTRL